MSHVSNQGERVALEPQLVELESVDGGDAGDSTPAKKKKFKILGYTGQPVMLGGAPTIFDLEGMECPERVPALMRHDLERVVGLATKITKTKSKLSLEGDVYESTADAQRIAELQEEGFPWQASVGLHGVAEEYVAEGESRKVNGRTFRGPGWHVTKSSLREISFTPLGADGATAAAFLESSPGGGIERRKALMANTDTATLQVAEISKAFRDDPGFALTCLEQGLTLDQAKAAYADRLSQRIVELEAGHAKELASRDERIAELEAQLAEAEKAKATTAPSVNLSGGSHAVPIHNPNPSLKTGSDPRERGDWAELEGQTLGEKFRVALAKLSKEFGGDRTRATREVNSRYPGLREAMLAEANPARPAIGGGR